MKYGVRYLFKSENHNITDYGWIGSGYSHNLHISMSEHSDKDHYFETNNLNTAFKLKEYLHKMFFEACYIFNVMEKK